MKPVTIWITQYSWWPSTPNRQHLLLRSPISIFLHAAFFRLSQLLNQNPKNFEYPQNAISAVPTRNFWRVDDFGSKLSPHQKLQLGVPFLHFWNVWNFWVRCSLSKNKPHMKSCWSAIPKKKWCQSAVDDHWRAQNQFTCHDTCPILQKSQSFEGTFKKVPVFTPALCVCKIIKASKSTIFLTDCGSTRDEMDKKLFCLSRFGNIPDDSETLSASVSTRTVEEFTYFCRVDFH